MGGALRWLRLLLICGVVLTFYFVVPATPRLPRSDVLGRTVATVACLVVLAYLVIRQLRLQIDQGTDRRVDGLVIAVIGVVVVFSMCFYLLVRQNPAQVSGLHTRLDALYFTMTTLTTVGYGDVHAQGQAARALVVIQMLFNLVFVAAAAALLSHRLRTRVGERAASRKAQNG